MMHKHYDLQNKTWVEVASADAPDEPGLGTQVEDYEEAHRLARVVFAVDEISQGMMGEVWARDADGYNQEIPHPPDRAAIGGAWLND